MTTEQAQRLGTRIRAAVSAGGSVEGGVLAMVKLEAAKWTSEDIEHLDAILVDALTEFGLGDDDEPNAFGLEIESAIDHVHSQSLR